ncbi:MAG: hypothetical protein WCP53_11050 [Verrucomicrobiota bacterium]
MSFSADVVGRAQTGQAGVTAPTAAVNVTGIAGGQPRGIRGVTRQTMMTAPGQQARTFFTAGGVDLGGSTTPGNAAVAAPAPVVAETPMEGLDRPEVRRALRQLADSGDADAKRLLAKPVLAARPARR